MTKQTVGSDNRPFLKAVTTLGKPDTSRYPFNIPALSQGVNIQITRNITFLVGENGSGKSTILEAVAEKCGFNAMGGNRNHNYLVDTLQSELAPFLRLSWRQKLTQGFFMRAESFFNFATYMDQIESESPGVLGAYGGKSLHSQSHGEALLSLFANRFSEGIYLLDEPEAALSPQRQLSFLRILYELERRGGAQFLIASHSPLLFSYPNATIFVLDSDGVREVSFQETEHYMLMKRFLDSPDRYFHYLFSDAD